MWQPVVVAIIFAFLGDQVGFYLGHRFGRRLFKPDARVLKTEYLEEAEAFFAKYGPVALVLGRFCPDCSHLCAALCRHCKYEVPQVHRLECHWCSAVGVLDGRRRCAAGGILVNC